MVGCEEDINVCGFRLNTTELAGSIPVSFGPMFLIVNLLFNSLKKTLIIWLTVPMAIIGVTAGLLVATVLTLIFVPVLFTFVFRIASPAKGGR